MDLDIELRAAGEFTDPELNGLHAEAFGHPLTEEPWGQRLAHHSLTWITARLEGQLVGFVNVIWDGGRHAVLLDTCVAPDLRGHGIGTALVAAAGHEARRSGCQWLHADYEPHLVDFYEGACGMRHSEAGLLRLEGND
ncbi:GNAT family N-acetyltransferase [Cellulomonas sp. URHB0016]